MSHILDSFKKWKSSINEQQTPSRVKLTNDINQKAIINPIDKASFKVRAKWTDDMIDANGRLTPSGFNAILAEIRNYVDPSTGQASLINYYSGLKDLTRNIVIYDVIRDTDTAKDPNPKVRKQAFKFTVASRELYPNVPQNVLHIRQDEVTKAQAGKDVQAGPTTSTGEVLTSSDTFGIDFSRGAVYINNPSDAKMIKLIDSFYFKLSADDVLLGIKIKPINELRRAVAAELKAGKLGESSKTLIVSLNAAFGIVTRYGDIETGVTQPLLQKLKEVKSAAPGAEATGTRLSETAGFNKDTFISSLSASTSSDVKAPAGGFKKGAVVRDPEFMKFQQLLAQKFGKSLGSSQIYKNFAKFKTGGADGTYGSNTANLVGLLKKALTEPTWTGNGDKNIVDQDFINRIAQEKITESYLALDGFTLITEGIDIGVVTAYEKSETPRRATNSANRKRVDSKTKDDKKKVSTLTLDEAAAKELDKLFIKLAESVKTYFETDSNFSAYSGGDDDEQGAWDNIAMKRINRIFMPELNKIKKELDRYTKDPLDLKGDYKKSVWTFENKVFFNGDIKGKETRLKSKFMNYSKFSLGIKGEGFPFNFKLFLYDGVKSYTIKTDF